MLLLVFYAVLIKTVVVQNAFRTPYIFHHSPLLSFSPFLVTFARSDPHWTQAAIQASLGAVGR